MNTFKEELQKIIPHCQSIKDVEFAGRMAMGSLGGELRGRVEFITSGMQDHFDTVKVSVINREKGTIDTLAIKIGEVWGRLKGGNDPYIWRWSPDAEYEWYNYRPVPEQYKALAEEIDRYLKMFVAPSK